MKILMLSHTADFGVFRVGSHHLSREFARLGHHVTHVSTPISVPQRLAGRATANRLSAARRGVFTDTEGVVHSVGTVALPLRIAAQSGMVARCIERAGGDDADLIFVDEPLMAPAIRRSHAATVIYRPTDVYASGVRARRQNDALGKADGVIATSDVVLASLPIPAGLPSKVVENGVELERFEAPGAGGAARDGAVYVGALDDRFDWRALSEMASGSPATRFDIYGPLPGDAPAVPSNVALRGAIDYAEVPKVLARARVGLLPFTSTRTSMGRSPMKFYEYLAAGLNVVGSKTPVLASRNAPGTRLYRSLSEASASFRFALSLPAPNVEGQRVARLHAWPSKAADVLDFALSIRPSHR